MNVILNLVLDDKTAIFCNSENSLEDTFFCDDIKISLKINNKVHLLDEDCLHYTLQVFKDQLLSVLHNSLKLDFSISKDIGYLWNEYLTKESKEQFIYNLRENRPYWIGQDYYLWETVNVTKLTTWLYNNEKGEIILEITPSYPWHFSDPTPEENFIPYEQWIKDYKPFIIRTIPQEVAKRWLAQVEHLIEVFEKKEKNHIQN